MARGLSEQIAQIFRGADVTNLKALAARPGLPNSATAAGSASDGQTGCPGASIRAASPNVTDYSVEAWAEPMDVMPGLRIWQAVALLP